MKLIAATNNHGKIKEIRQILSDCIILSLKDINYNKDIVENGHTFYENALLKASFIYNTFHNDFPDSFILADDSGLEIIALDGKPGIYSARFAGPNSTQDMLITKVLNEMRGLPDEKRNARFFCTMVLIFPDGSSHSSEGICEGKIAFNSKGNNGFGYDPIFLVKEYNYKKTMAELSDDEKNAISHRRMALESIKKIMGQL